MGCANFGTMDPPRTAIVHVTCVQKCRRAKANGTSRGMAGFAVAFGGLEDDARVSERHKTEISMEMRLPLKKLNKCQDFAAVSAS